MEYIDDLTYIKDMKHMQNGPWHQYDVLIDARGYGWSTMIDWADYVRKADISDVQFRRIPQRVGGVPNTEIEISLLSR